MNTAVAFSRNYIQTPAFSRVARSPYKRLREEVEKAVPSLKAGKSPGVNNIPSELLKNGSGARTSPDSNMPEDLGDKEVAEGVDTIARHPFTKERQPQAMSKLSYH